MVEQTELKDPHIHDLLHEGISRVETGKFSLVDLQAFRGRCDSRMLLRYGHFCTKRPAADGLDQSFSTTARTPPEIELHRGGRRIRTGNGLSLAVIVSDFETEERPARKVDIAFSSFAGLHRIPCHQASYVGSRTMRGVAALGH
jgi:hypothetical protein